jgi:alkylation response protein AidB-like acyl-CoA dehydrogenase
VSKNIEAVLSATRDVAAGAVVANAARIDREREYPRENLQALSEAGALGLVVPVEHGGAGGGLSVLAEACESIGGAVPRCARYSAV